jgi:hypothetical protein
MILRILLVLSFLPAYVFGQYSTANNFLDLTFEDLVSTSGGTVTLEDEHFRITANLTISATDTLRHDGGLQLLLDPGVLLTVQGGLFLDMEAGSLITTAQDGLNYEGFRFEDGSVIELRKGIFDFGSGLRVLTANFLMDSCVVSNQAISNSTGGALGLSTGKPRIKNSDFINNQRSAISSAANAEVAPIIENCYFYNNVSENSNRPQINLGPSGAADTTIIRNNIIAGNPLNTLAGGIAFTSLVGIQSHGVIEGNYVFDNRYGITATGNNLYTLIMNNEIIDNNTQGEPLQGGSGINIYSTAANMSTISGNLIAGNLWGITLQENAMANLGDTTLANYNVGANIFDNNANGGEVYALFNNTPNSVMAMNNCWMLGVIATPEDAESVISHVVDDETLGEVHFLPLNTCVFTNLYETDSDSEIRVYPNPASDLVIIENQIPMEKLVVYNSAGQQVLNLESNTSNRMVLSVKDWPKGIYLIQTFQKGMAQTTRLMKH